MTEDVRQPFPRCDKCGHQFHGLPCAAMSTPLIGTGRKTGPCGCIGAFDDDFWKDGVQ